MAKTTRRLDREWQDHYAHTEEGIAALRIWQLTDQALHGIEDLDALLEARRDPDRAYDILAALGRRAPHDLIAARTLFQALLPGLVALGGASGPKTFPSWSSRRIIPVTARRKPVLSMPDLDNRGAIHDLVIHFYREVAFDDLLGPMFGEVAEVDWAEHIPRLIGYWCRVLLGHASYDGRILSAHGGVHAERRFDAELFDRWYRLFVESVDSAWSEPYAERAKGYAAHMAGVISRRLTGDDFQVVRDLRH